MLSEEQIRQALHASRVVPLAIATPHGPFGLEQFAAAVSRVNPALGSGDSRVRRLIAHGSLIFFGVSKISVC
jgi:hypothetical protein